MLYGNTKRPDGDFAILFLGRFPFCFSRVIRPNAFFDWQQKENMPEWQDCGSVPLHEGVLGGVTIILMLDFFH